MTAYYLQQPVTQWPVLDRALAYGDGFFTTLSWRQGPCLWAYHAARLRECAQRLGFAALDIEAIYQDVLLAGSILDVGVIKILVSRGVGGRAYSPTGADTPTWWVQAFAKAANIEQIRQHGYRVGISNLQLAHQPLLAGLKTLNRLEQVLARQHADQQGWDDALVCDQHGQALEGISSNFLYLVDDTWYTPTLNQCGVHGVMRQFLLDQQLIQLAPPQQLVPLRAKLQACALSNAVIGVVPITQLEDQQFSTAAALKLQAAVKDVIC